MSNQYLPHQQRVIDEKTELDMKLIALTSFFSTDIFKGLNQKNQDLLTSQEVAMDEYSQILAERISLF
jgi:hypothetical protein